MKNTQITTECYALISYLKLLKSIPTGNMAFITTIKPDYVSPITLISCVMHEEDLTEKNPIILNSTFDGNSHTSLTHRNVPGKIFKCPEKAFAGICGKNK